MGKDKTKLKHQPEILEKPSSITIESTDKRFVCALIDWISHYPTVIPQSTVIRINNS